MNEIWKDIKDYPNYQVSNLGKVKNAKTNKILKPFSPIGEYLKVSLSKNGKAKHYFIHRLVAETFIPNPNNYPCVNHKDENPSNNCVSNLEWCSYQYNNNYGTRNGKVAEKLRKVKCKKVRQYDLNGNYIKTWNSIKEAEKEVGSTHISQCTKGRFKQTKGYKWRYD